MRSGILSFESRLIFKGGFVCGLDPAESGTWSGSTLFALGTEIYVMDDNNINKPDTPFDTTRTCSNKDVEESTQH